MPAYMKVMQADAALVPRWPILFQLDILSSITVVELGARYAAPVQPSIQQGMASTGLVPVFGQVRTFSETKIELFRGRTSR